MLYMKARHPHLSHISTHFFSFSRPGFIIEVNRNSIVRQLCFTWNSAIFWKVAMLMSTAMAVFITRGILSSSSDSSEKIKTGFSNHWPLRIIHLIQGFPSTSKSLLLDVFFNLLDSSSCISCKPDKEKSISHLAYPEQPRYSCTRFWSCSGPTWESYKCSYRRHNRPSTLWSTSDQLWLLLSHLSSLTSGNKAKRRINR